MNLDSFIENENLDNDEVKKVKEYIESIKKSREKQGNEECIYWKRGCNNQLCPMLKDNSKSVWYSDEDLCSNPEYRDNIVVINQKKLKKKNAPGYFTYNMLNRNFIIKKGIEGIDPDVPDSIDSKGQKAVDKLYKDRGESWFKEHPELTEEQIEKKRIQGENLKKYMEGKK